MYTDVAACPAAPGGFFVGVWSFEGPVIRKCLQWISSQQSAKLFGVLCALDFARSSRCKHVDVVMENVDAIALILWGRASTLIVAQQRILQRVAHRLRWQGVSVGLRYVESALDPTDYVSRWSGRGGGGVWLWRHGLRLGSTASGRVGFGRQWGITIRGSRCGTRTWWVDRACDVVAPCAARYMSAPRRSAYRAADNTGRVTAETLRAVPRTRERAAKWVVDTASPPAHVAEQAVAAVRPAAVSEQLQQVPRGQGSRATHRHHERRIRGGNR